MHVCRHRFQFEDYTGSCSLSPLFCERGNVSQKYIIQESTCDILLFICVHISMFPLDMPVQDKSWRLPVAFVFQRDMVEKIFFSQSNLSEHVPSSFPALPTDHCGTETKCKCTMQNVQWSLSYNSGLGFFFGFFLYYQYWSNSGAILL